MKKIFIILSACMICAFLFTMNNGLQSRSNGNVAGMTGAPRAGGGNESTCAQCHGGAVNSGPNSVAITVSGNPSGFDPGQTYSMTASIVNTSATQAGFSVTCLSPALAGTGTFTTGPGTRIVTDPQSGRSYLNHNTPGTGTWTFSWTAPSQDVPDSVTFYAAGREASPVNNIYTSKFVFRKNVTTDNKNLLYGSSMIPYPNPASKQVVFSSQPVAYKIMSVSGLEIKSGHAAGKEPVSLNGIGAGIYFWEANDGSKTFKGQLVVE
jgi:hypothetical protein